MIDFHMTMGGFDVLKGGTRTRTLVGHISREYGFFIDPTTIQKFVALSLDDLRDIAYKVDQVRRGGRL